MPISGYKRGVSSFVAVLLLIGLSVSAGIVIYSFTMGNLGSLPDNPEGHLAGLMTLDSYKFTSEGITVYIRNMGNSRIILDYVYVNSARAQGTGYIIEVNGPGVGDDEISSGEAGAVSVQIPGGFEAGNRYEFHFIMEDNTQLKFTAKSPITQSGEIPPEPPAWLGDSSDGPLLVNGGDTMVNDYAYLVDNVNNGDTITVNDASGFSVDDEVLILQVQDTTGGNAGRYEFQYIASLNGNEITLTANLDNTYYSGTFDVVGATTSQIIRVPQYTDVTVETGNRVTSSSWDGYIGGVVVFRASGTMTIEAGGSIDVSEQGYRGGAFGPSYNQDGYQGESYTGMGIGGNGYGTGRMNNAGGGGSYICGGGGEYGGGATDSDPWTGSGDTYARKGNVYGTADLSELHFGSGGGGQWDGQDTFGPPSEGGIGGGIILVYADTITAPTDSFRANGQSTYGIQRGSYTYGSSGGAGGSIYLQALTIQGATDFCMALGGLGNHDPIRDGGDGGVGRIRVDADDLTGTTDPVHYSG